MYVAKRPYDIYETGKTNLLTDFWAANEWQACRWEILHSMKTKCENKNLGKKQIGENESKRKHQVRNVRCADDALMLVCVNTSI